MWQRTFQRTSVFPLTTYQAERGPSPKTTPPIIAQTVPLSGDPTDTQTGSLPRHGRRSVLACELISPRDAEHLRHAWSARLANGRTERGWWRTLGKHDVGARLARWCSNGSGGQKFRPTPTEGVVGGEMETPVITGNPRRCQTPKQLPAGLRE